MFTLYYSVPLHQADGHMTELLAGAAKSVKMKIGQPVHTATAADDDLDRKEFIRYPFTFNYGDTVIMNFTLGQLADRGLQLGVAIGQALAHQS